MPEFPRITHSSHVMNGRPCLRDTCVAVTTVISLLASGRSQIEIIKMFPALSIEDIHEALSYAAWRIDPSETIYAVSPEAAQPVIPPAPKYLQPPRPAEVPPLPPEEEPAAPAPEEQESLQFFHPSRPDHATVLLSNHGIIDRRWSTGIVAWCDIRDIRRITGEKTIVVTLRNPKSYLSTMPFFERFITRIRLLINMHSLYLDTASLGARTQTILVAAQHLWIQHRGCSRKRRRSRKGKSNKNQSLLADEFQLK